MKGAERGPVYLGVSKEVLTSVDACRGEITDSVSDSWQRKPVDLIKMRSSAFETFLANNQRCIILAGLRGKTPETSRALIDFAEAYGFPVATTLSAKGFFLKIIRLHWGIWLFGSSSRH